MDLKANYVVVCKKTQLFEFKKKIITLSTYYKIKKYFICQLIRTMLLLYTANDLNNYHALWNTPIYL